jgi:transcription termination factor Rho
MPDDMMPISYRHTAQATDEDKVHKAAGEATHCNDLISAFEQYQRLVILGEPGAGKTFSLWKIAAEKAAKALTNESEMIPVVVPLNKWTDEAQSLQDFVLEQMADAAPFFNALTQQKKAIASAGCFKRNPICTTRSKASSSKGMDQTRLSKANHQLSRT